MTMPKTADKSAPAVLTESPQAPPAATMRPGEATPAVRPPVHASTPGVTTDGVRSSNPETPVIQPAPPQTLEHENEALRTELVRLRRGAGEEGSNCAPSPPGFPRLVTATRMLFYNNQRYREGDTFAIRDPSHFSGAMVWAQEGARQRQTSGTQHLKQFHDDLLGDRQAQSTGDTDVIPAT